MSIVDKILQVAENEVGYLEKRSNSQLYDKTANAGSGNYTKYWADTVPSYQGQPWCAAFVTWCMAKALGESRAALLLKHYPFVYCPALAAKGPLYEKPARGDVVLFYRKGEFAHTGFVTEVNGNRFSTVEGNTSGASGIIENGGGVFAKSYDISSLTGTKFFRPAYSQESEDLTVTQYEELKAAIAAKDEIINTMGAEIAELKAAQNKMIYNYIDQNMPEWAREGVSYCVDHGLIKGTGSGLGLDDKDLKYCTIIMRLYKKLTN